MVAVMGYLPKTPTSGFAGAAPSKSIFFALIVENLEHE